MKIDTLGLPKYGVEDCMDLIYKGKLDTLFKVYVKENKIVWGVGRGSSVASYVLYLLGIHKIDSIQYRLDWKEFIR